MQQVKPGLAKLFTQMAMQKSMKLAYEPLKRTRDAGVWLNSSFTETRHLFNILTYGIEQGWDWRHIRDLVDGVMPKVEGPDPYHPEKMGPRRKRNQYSPKAQALIGGYHHE